MGFLKELKGWLGRDSDSATHETDFNEDNPLFVYVKIPGHVEPMERGEKIEDPLQEALARSGFGNITGGGSQLSEEDSEGRRSIEFCGIDVDLYQMVEGLALLRRELVRLETPPGTVLLYEVNGQEYEEPILKTQQ